MREYSLRITYKEIFGGGTITRNVNVFHRSFGVLAEKQFLHDVSYQFTKKFLREKGKLIGKIMDIKILDEQEYY